ncbi:MAG: hypothetical protein ACLFV5_07360, partial [Anaerolineales bacterium]
MLSKNILYHGRERPPTRRRSLRAGPLTLLFEEDATMGGALRHIKLGDREILRRVYVAVRDRHWGTVPSTLSDVDVEAGDDSFRITFQVENVAGEINFFWRGTIAGDDRGTVTFIMDGRARSTFLRNRIGLCVLHPMGLAGQPCLVEHADGSLEEGEFPTYIAPHQPFQEMRAISHQVAPGVRAMVRVEGDVFEMEDQRNWTDASYKTYSTPLALPAPVEIEEGTRICQSIILRLEGMSAKGWAAVPSKEPPSFAVADASTHPLPQIGLAMAGHGQPLTEKECGRLRALHPSHLRANLHLTDPDYGAILQRATVEAWALNAPLEMALFLPEAPAGELGDLVKRLETLHPPVCRWLVFQQGAPTTPERAVRLVREHLADYAPRARFGGGTDRYFTELNRNRPPVEALDLVCYSLNPQVHAFDGLSLVEALRTQAVTVESARRFVGNLPLVVGPITLRPRSNPHTGETLAGDPRQVSLLGAGWTAGSLKYVAEGGAYGVTYYETTGWRGVMEREKSQDRSNAFPSIPGAVYPLYHVLADVAAYAGGCIVPSASSDRLRVDGLALEKGGRRRILLANLGPDPRRVTVRGLGDDGAAVRHLDETNVEEAMVDPESFRAREGQERETEGGTLDVRLRSY